MFEIFIRAPIFISHPRVIVIKLGSRTVNPTRSSSHAQFYHRGPHMGGLSPKGLRDTRKVKRARLDKEVDNR